MVAQRRGPVAGGTLLLDDTEESVVGTPLHQKAISTLADMLEELRGAHKHTWDVGRNLGFRGFPSPTVSRTRPSLMWWSTPARCPRASPR